MRKILMMGLAVVGMGLAGPAFAQEAAAEPDEALIAIRDNDVSLTCIQLGDEAAELSATMGGEPKGSLFGRLGGVVRQGAAMAIPGAGLVIAGADAVREPARVRREAEAMTAQNRWHYLNGLYAGRQCHERLEARAEAAAAPTVETTVSVASPVQGASEVRSTPQPAISAPTEASSPAISVGALATPTTAQPD